MRVKIASALLAALLLPAPALACSCVMPGPVTEENLGGTTVFQGTVRQVEPLPFTPDTAGPFSLGPEHRTTFDVTELVYSPDGAPDTVVITHTVSGATCGVNYVQGQSYFVVAQRHRGRMMAGLCVPFTEGAVRADLKAPDSLIRAMRGDTAQTPRSDKPCGDAP